MPNDQNSVKNLLPGTKVDIRISQEINQKRETDEPVQSFVSSVFDVLPNGMLALTMPTHGGRILLLPTGIRYEFVFTTDKGLLKAEGIIEQRYKQDNFYLFSVRLTTPLEKFQRREFFRLPCLIPMTFITLDERAASVEKMSQIHDLLQSEAGTSKIYGKGTIVDISGGGIRFVSPRDIRQSKYLLLNFTLSGSKGDVAAELLGRIVAAYPKKETDQFTYRVKILFKDTKLREQIVRFVFEEERKIRKREQGE